MRQPLALTLCLAFTGIALSGTRGEAPAPRPERVVVWDGRYRSVDSLAGFGVKPKPSKDPTRADSDALVDKMREKTGKGDLRVSQTLQADLEGPQPTNQAQAGSGRSNAIAVCTTKDDPLTTFIGVLTTSGEVRITTLKAPYLRWVMVLKVLSLTQEGKEQLLVRDMDGGSAGTAGHLSILEYSDGTLKPFQGTPLFPWMRYRDCISAVRLMWDGKRVIPEYFGLTGPGAWASMGSNPRIAGDGSDPSALYLVVRNIHPKPLAQDPRVVANVKDAYFGSRMEKVMSPSAVQAMILALGENLDDTDMTSMPPLKDTVEAQRKEADKKIEQGMILVLGAPWPASSSFGQAVIDAPDYDKAWAALGLSMMKAGHIPFAKFCYKELRILKSPLAKTMQDSCKVKLD